MSGQFLSIKTTCTAKFSITTKVVAEDVITDEIPLRYKALVTKDGEPLQGQEIKYGDGFELGFTTDENGVAYFGPDVGFKASEVPELTGEGRKTQFQADLDAGQYSLTVSLVDISDEGEVELGKGTKEFIVLGKQSTYKLTHTGLAESYTAGDLINVTEKTQAQINAAVEAAIEGIAPVQVTLATDVLGKTGYDAVRITPVEAGNNIQLWAKDTANNWYDINVTGWGPPGGFALPAQYNVTTDIYVLSNAAGDYTLNIKLVNASDNAVIAEASGTVKVSTVQVSDENGLNAALADNNVKTIKFAKDVTLTQQVNIARDIVIDGQGKNLTGTDSLRAFMVQGEGIDVTIQNINFATFTQGTTVNSVGTIAIKNNTYTNVYRCMDFGSGLTSENVTITGNTFNLSEGNRAVSYPVKATKDDIQSILDNNTFPDSTDPDYLIKYYSGKYHYHLVNQPINTIENTGDGILIKVENKETSDHDNLGTITVSVEVTAENKDNLLEALTTKKADFVDEITIDTANKKVMIKSFDGKESCYYVIVNSNGEGEGA